uniref:NADH dehydrogenase subunit 6 n=1 Tax=Psyttalia concolor TaxID=389103 RepID=A0A8A4J8I1_9HYME|nr:NADH dehydrogenase subunit 6 [Psyttalia concolor]
MNFFMDTLFMNMLILLDFLLIILMIIPNNYYYYHPLLMAMILIFFTIIMSIKLNYLLNSFWYSYILFLVMIGGLMILFMYFTSLINNQLFYLKSKNYLYLIVKFLIFMMIVYFYMKMYNLMYIDNFELINLNKFFKFMELDLFKNMFMDYVFDLTIYTIMYLFFMMICSVIICLKSKIPLRQINKINN